MLKSFKKIQYGCLLAFVLSCQYSSEKESNPANEVIISGKISGSYWRTIHLITVSDITERYIEFDFEPDSTEIFTFKIKKEIANRFRLEVGPNSFEGWLYPGDSVYLEATICSDNEEFIRKIEFSGKSVDQYRYFQRIALNPIAGQIDDLKNEAVNADYLDFKSKFQNAYSLSLKQFVEDTTGLQLNEEFLIHELNQMKYGYLNNLTREPMLRKNKRFDSTPVPNGYFSFLQEVDYQDSTFRNSHQLYRFLTDAADALNEADIPPELGIARFDAFLEGRLRFSDSLLSGTVKEIFESKSLDTYAKYDLDRFDSLRTYLEAKGYNNPILHFYKELSDSLRSLEFRIDNEISVYTQNERPVNLLSQIKEHKYTYLNIWFIGCKGCMLDFEKQEYFVKKYYPEVQFLNICTNKPGARFDAFVAKYGETGIHLFDLNGELTNKIKAYPYHGLFNQDGELLMNNAFRPIDPKLDPFLEKLIIRTN